MKFNSHLKIRFFIHFTEKLFEGLVIPFFVIYISGYINPTVVGLSLLLITIISTVASLWGGYISDLKGRRKITIYSELVKTVALFFISIAIFIHINFYIIILLYLVICTLNSVVSSVSEAFTLDVLKQDQAKDVYNILYWLTNLGRSVGTISGVILYDMYGFNSLTFICGIFSLVSLFLVISKLQETVLVKADIQSTPNNFINQYKIIFKDKKLLYLLLANTLHFGISIQLTYYIAMRLSIEFPMQKIIAVGTYVVAITGIQMFGILRLQTNFMVILLSPWVQRATKYINNWHIFIIFPILASICFAVMMVSNSAWILMLSMTFYTLSEMVYLPVLQSLLVYVAEKNSRAKYTSIKSLDFRLAMVIGSIFIMMSKFFPSYVLAYVIIIMGLMVTYFSLKLIQKIN
ncbi:MAG: MFS transporter [Neisseriaceae bacterium]|nr:MAG: MFS transporter [Neisseriaceae bacterium]